MKPHFFTKTGQKLVFLHKNKWTFLCETGKIGTPVSRKRVSFTQKSTVSRFTVNLRKNKWTLSKCQLLCSQGVVSFTQKRSKLLPSWLWDGKFYHQVGKKKESLIEIVEFMVKILTMKLPVSRNETGKKVNFAWL